MKTLTILIGLGVMLAPSLLWAAEAGTWQKGCQTGTGQVITNLTTRGFACWDPVAANTDDSPLLSMSDCDNIDIYFYPDKTGGLTDSTVTYDLTTCPSDGISLSETQRDNACFLIDGITTGVTECSGCPTVGWLRIEALAAGANPASGRFIAQCN